MKHFKFYNNQKIVFLLFWVMLILPNLVMFFTEPTTALTRIIQIVLPLSFYGFALTFNKKPGVMFWWLFLFIFIDAFQIVLLHLFGESPIAVDMFLNVVTTNATEVNELLGNLIPAVLFVFVIYGGGIALSICSIKNQSIIALKFRQSVRHITLTGLLISGILVVTNYSIDKRFELLDDVFPVNGCYNLYLSFGRYADGANYHNTSSGFTYSAYSTRPDSVPEVYVMVIGETMRATNMGIYGYHRNTTPMLNKMSSDLAIFGDALTMSNTTHKSVPMLMSPIASEQFDSLYTQRGILTAFKEAGFETSFYSNQRRNGSFIDFLGSEANDAVFVKDSVSIVDNVSDSTLLVLLNKKIHNSKSKKLFVILHCYGSHFNYSDRYPEEYAFYKPCTVVSADKEYRNILINAYDNTVRYTDYLLWRITKALEGIDAPSVMLYTSDHGEDIYDDYRNRFLHASPTPTFNQLRVPFLIWTSKQYQNKYPELWTTLQSNCKKPISTSLVAFHTLLDMGGINTKYFCPEHSLCNKSFTVTQRLYVTDHNDYKPLDDVGLRQVDIQQFKQNNLRFP